MSYFKGGYSMRYFILMKIVELSKGLARRINTTPSAYGEILSDLTLIRNEINRLTLILKKGV